MGSRASEYRYRQLAEPSPDAILIWDRHSRFDYVNPNAAAWLGVGPQQMLGRSRSDFFPRELVEQEQLILNRVFAGGKTESVEKILPISAASLSLALCLCNYWADSLLFLIFHRAAKKALFKAHDKRFKQAKVFHKV